jgi:hypothetical protein
VLRLVGYEARIVIVGGFGHRVCILSPHTHSTSRKRTAIIAWTEGKLKQVACTKRPRALYPCLRMLREAVHCQSENRPMVAPRHSTNMSASLANQHAVFNGHRPLGNTII